MSEKQWVMRKECNTDYMKQIQTDTKYKQQTKQNRTEKLKFNFLMHKFF